MNIVDLQFCKDNIDMYSICVYLVVNKHSCATQTIFEECAATNKGCCLQQCNKAYIQVC